MTEMTFEARADLSQYLAELQKGEKALNAFVANATMAPAALTRAFAVLGRGGKAVEAFTRRAQQAQGFLTKIARTAKGTAEFAGSIDRVAKMAGVSAEALQGFRFAATQSGADIETFDKALVGFGERLREARKGSGEFHDVLRGLGVSFEGAEGRARATEDVFLDYAEAVRKARDPLKQNELAIAGFGTEGAVMVDLLARGRDGMAELREEARELGVVLSDQLVEAAKEANAQFSKLEQVVDVNFARAVASGLPFAGGQAELVAKLGPSLKDLTESFLPDDLRSSGALRREIEEMRAKLRKLREEGDPVHGAPDPKKAPPASSERFRRLKIERLLNEIAELVALLRRREQDRGGILGGAAGGGLLPGGANDDVLFGGVAFDEAGNSLLSFSEVLDGLPGGFEAARQAAGDYGSETRTLNGLLEKSNLQFTEQTGLIGALRQLVPELGGDFVKIFDETTEQGRELNRVILGLGTSFIDAFTKAALEGGNLSDVLRQLAEDVLRIPRPGGGGSFLSGFFGSIFGGGSTSSAAASTPAFFAPTMLASKGGVFDKGKAQRFAAGGVLGRATLFPLAGGVGLAGEAGPEAILPLARLSGGKLGVRASLPRRQGLRVAQATRRDRKSHYRFCCISIGPKRSIRTTWSDGSLVPSTSALRRRGPRSEVYALPGTKRHRNSPRTIAPEGSCAP